MDEKIIRAKELLESSERPVFVFDDDCDGIASFLLLYGFVKKGTPMVIKSSPNLTEKYATTINSFNPDLLVILDIALVQEEALRMVGCDVIWIDHHEPQEPQNTLYINPQLEGEEYPTSLATYNIVNDNLWLCVAGCISDYYYPEELVEKLRIESPSLLDDKNSIDSIHYETNLGKIIDILSFSMKGTVKDALSLIRILMKLESVNDLLIEDNKMKKLIKHYNNVKLKYDELKKNALESFQKQEGMLKVFFYDSDGWSLTHELSSELASYYPDNIIIVGRPYASRMLLSLRSRNHEIKSTLEKIMVSFDGTGGGHPHACGANVLKEDAERFIQSFKESYD